MTKKKNSLEILDVINSKHLVMGHMGQIGSALMKVLAPYNPQGYDLNGKTKELNTIGLYDFLHVAIPFNENFVDSVSKCVAFLLKDDGIIIVHSTVPVGTCNKLGPNTVHSPVRGVHPNLEDGIRTFVKFFGGPKAVEAAAIFKNVNVLVHTCPDTQTTELAKLWDTSYYAACIAVERFVKEACESIGADFNVAYTMFNDSYNKGYAKLGRSNVVRPVLVDMPGPCGGHCVIPNLSLLAPVSSQTCAYFLASILKVLSEEK